MNLDNYIKKAIIFLARAISILLFFHAGYLIFDEIKYYGMNAFMHIWVGILVMIILSEIIALKFSKLGGILILLNFFSFRIYLIIIKKLDFFMITSHEFYLFKSSYLILFSGILFLLEWYCVRDK